VTRFGDHQRMESLERTFQSNALLSVTLPRNRTLPQGNVALRARPRYKILDATSSWSLCRKTRRWYLKPTSRTCLILKRSG